MTSIHNIRGWMKLSLLSITVFSGSLHAATAVAQDEPQGVDRPLVTFAVASYERISGGIETIFAAADRPELANLVDGFIANVGDLKGWDRERPFGAMVLLNPGIAPEPVVVGFAPVSNWETVLASYTSGIFRIQPSPDHADRYELIMPEGNKLLLRVVGDYAYFSKKPETLNREFVSPSRWLAKSAERYDAWSTVHFHHVPEGLRTVVIDYIRASSQQQLTQRDGESDARFEGRKIGTEAAIDWFELTATDGETLTAGWQIDPETRAFSAEAVLTAKDGTGLAASLNSMGSQPDRFAPLSPAGTPFQLSTSWVMGDSIASMLQHAFDVGYENGREKGREKPLEWSVIESVHSLMKATVADRHINQVVRIVGHPPAQFNLIGAMHFSGNGDLDAAMQSVYAAIVAGNDVATIEVKADTHQGIEIHKLKPIRYQEAAVLLYGKEAALYVAKVGDDLWYSFGGSKALEELKSSIDRVTAAAGGMSPEAEGRILELSFDLASWLTFIPQANPNVSQTARQAFAAGGDGLGVRLQQITNGTQFRLTLGKGYLRLVGLLIAGAIDERRN
ncbi:MAG: hypothetical protein WEB58_14700 [Planctomycetaceae bacterium]